MTTLPQCTARQPKQRGFWPAVALLGLLVCLADPAFARPDSLVGKWRFNPGQSELLPGEPAPDELIMDITKDDGRVFQWTVTVRLPGGQSGATHFDGAIDGKAYPVKGRPGSTSTFTWLSDGSLKQVSESPGGFSTEICTFPPSGKRFVCEARQVDAQGHAAAYTEVFDRVTAR
jgi:hypothetical protein